MTAASVRVAGVDGCRGGWVIATAIVERDEIASLRVGFTPRLASLVDALRAGELAALGVDMPIGLPETGRRAADAEARALLGPRRSSLFPTPPRAVLASTDYADALAECRAASGVGISRQAFNLLPKMRELAALATPCLQPALSEVHPETTFAVLGGRPCAHPKRSPAGVAERLALLSAAVPSAFPSAVASASEILTARPAPGVGVHDVLDACAAAWTAARIATGCATWLGDVDARDECGLRLTIAV